MPFLGSPAQRQVQAGAQKAQFLSVVRNDGETDGTAIPKGLGPPAQGLPSPRGYPGLASVRSSTSTGLSPRSTIGPQPLGLADTSRFYQGCEPRATPGFGMESLWDSALEFPKGRGSNPGGIGLQACVTSQQLRDPNIQHGTSNIQLGTPIPPHPTLSPEADLYPQLIRWTPSPPWAKLAG